MEFSFLQLTDYNDLYTIAVGLSMAYIIVEARMVGKSSSLPFFSFLNQLSTSFMEWIIDRKTQPQQKEEQTTARITYYLDSGLLTDRIAGALEHIKNKVRDNLIKVQQLDDRSKERMLYHTKADYLHVISFDSFLFGILLLVIGPIESVHFYNVDSIVCCMNIFMTLSLLHCIVSDKLKIYSGWFKPRKLVHTLSFIVFLLLSIYLLPTFELSEYPYWHSFNLFYALSMCFMGFIAYTICAVCGCSWVCVCSIRQIWNMSLSHVASEHESDLQRYSDELAEVDEQLNVGSSDFQINGDSTQTLPN